MTEAGQLREGYLVIADLSGYTRFVTTTELEHAQSIVDDLTSLIVRCLAPPLRLVKLEGDAVLCCAESRTFEDGERLIELIEVCYLDFCQRRTAMARATSCTCAACSEIDTLDLKFVAHYGQYLPQRVGELQDIAGPDVIVVHRLLKNSIAECMDCPAYAFFTDACLARLPASFELPRHVEEYESLGEIAGGVYDLRPVLEGLRQTAGQYVGPGDADFEFRGTAKVPPAVVWPYFIEPEKLVQWQGDMVAASNEPNADGRFGRGAISHCDHGSSQTAHRVVDWRPFHYYTMVDTPVKRSFLAWSDATTTVEFRPTDDCQTTISFRFRLHDRSRLSRLKLRLMAPMIRHAFARNAGLLAELLVRDGLIADTR